MKKKLLLLTLCISLIGGLLSGCGNNESKKSTDNKQYFQNLEKMQETVLTGTTTMELKAAISGDDLKSAGTPDYFMENPETWYIAIKAELASQDNNHGALRLYARGGNDTEYKEITTLVLDQKRVYLTLDKIGSFGDAVRPGQGAEFYKALKQMGITKDAVYIDLDKLEASNDIKKIFNSAFEGNKENNAEIFPILQKYFGNLTNGITLKIDKSNSQIVIEDAIKLFQNKEIRELFAKIASKNSDIKTITDEEWDEIVEELKKKDTQDKFNKVFTNGGTILSTANYTNQKGSFTLNLNDAKIETSKNSVLNFSFSMIGEKNHPNVKDYIPEDALDLTPMINQLFTTM